MSRIGSEPLGAALLAEAVLRPADQHTQVRLAELFVGPAGRTPTGHPDPGPAPAPPWEPAPVVPPVPPATPPRRRIDLVANSLTGFLSVSAQLWRAFIGLMPSRGSDAPLRSELSRPVLTVPGGRTGLTLDAPGPAVEPTVPPLLLPRWTRAIVTTALATDRPGGAVEIERLTECLARLEPPTRLPRRRRRTLGAGADVLIDISDEMIPFREDIRSLSATLDTVVGRDRLTVQRFAGRPLTRVGSGGRATWAPYRPPITPRCVLVVSNLRIGGADFADDNAMFLRELAAVVEVANRARCRVVILVPNSVSRVPDVLRAKAGVLEWDRSTSAADAARAARR